MPLDESQKKRVQEYLDTQYKCLRCGRYELYSAELVALPLVGAEATLPTLAVGCSNCGYVQFYSSKTVGLT
jgi:predicted nucleic-acid-binding Zn-ribbon protein